MSTWTLTAVGPQSGKLDTSDAESDGDDRYTNLLGQRYCVWRDFDEVSNVQRLPGNFMFDTLETEIHLVFKLHRRFPRDVNKLAKNDRLVWKKELEVPESF